jgi:hypothetical protein
MRPDDAPTAPASVDGAGTRFVGDLSGAITLLVIANAAAQVFSLAFLPDVLLAGLLLGYVALNASRVRRSGWAVLAAALALSAVALTYQPQEITPALKRAGLLFALFAVLALLSRISMRSPDVVRGAEIITSRPPGIRYLFLTFGSHVFAVFLNFGAVAVMMSMLATRMDELKRRGLVRSLSLAVLRGFAATPFWSPLSLSLVVTLSIVRDVSYAEVAPFGVPAALAYLLAGYFLDRSSGISQAQRSGLPSREEGRVLLRVGARIGALLATVIGLAWLVAIRFVDAVLLAVLAMNVVWIAAQKMGRDGGQVRPWGDLTLSGRTIANEVVLISSAGFIGSIASHLLADLHWLESGLSAAAAGLAAFLIPWAVFAAGTLAINPIISGSLVAGLLDPVWPSAAKPWLVLAILAGWGITAAGTPFTANMLIAARIAERSPLEMSYRWNGALTASSLVIASVIVALAVLLAS